MEWPDIQRRIRPGEDARTEFERGVGDMRAVGKTLCAFANGDSGKIVGAGADSDAVQERLTGLLHTGCGKPVTAQCARRNTAAGWVVLDLTCIAIQRNRAGAGQRRAQ